MANVWARDRSVACTHPGRAALHGRDAVMASWRAILGSPEPPDIDFDLAEAVVLGDSAFVTCVELVGEARIAATNVFVLERGEWRMVHHHGGPLASTDEPRRSAPTPLN
jgi:ketosteroid isomerase-like protein